MNAYQSEATELTVGVVSIFVTLLVKLRKALKMFDLVSKKCIPFKELSLFELLLSHLSRGSL